MCSIGPKIGCRTAAKSQLLLKKGVPESKNKLLWQWVNGQTTALSEFGSPTKSTIYNLCILDASGRVAQARVPPGGTCGVKPCWRAASSKLTYKDAALSHDGIKKILLRARTEDKSKIVVLGEGQNLFDPPVQLTAPVIAQLSSSDPGTPCFSAAYTGSQVLANDSDLFKAKLP